jgi:hypothetical protein
VSAERAQFLASSLTGAINLSIVGTPVYPNPTPKLSISKLSQFKRKSLHCGGKLGCASIPASVASVPVALNGVRRKRPWKPTCDP